jgi:hypothetical protein
MEEKDIYLKGGKTEYVYLISDGAKYKIGKSTNLKRRYKSLRTSNPDITLIGYTDRFTEEELHNKYKEYHYKLEWFIFPDHFIPEVLNDFSNTKNDFNIKYYRQYNVILDEDTCTWVNYNNTGFDLRNYERFLSKSGKYTLGEFSFASKDNIRKFLRGLLNDLPIGKTILDPKIIKIVEELIRMHPKYDGFLEKDGYDYIKTKLDTEDTPTESNRYSNFCFVFKDGSEWNFSNVKCLQGEQRAPRVAKAIVEEKPPMYVPNDYFSREYVLTFGKNTGKSLDYMLENDKGYIKWAYENIKEFKRFIDRSKYKNIVKINVNQQDKLFFKKH